MKIFKLVTLLILVLSISAFSEIKFEKDWEVALENGKKFGKRVFIDFYTDWCPPCKKLNKTTFVNKKMEDYFKTEDYILVKSQS